MPIRFNDSRISSQYRALETQLRNDPNTKIGDAQVLQLLGAVADSSSKSFSRAVGEFGAIVIVSGNIPLKTQTAAVYVMGQVESANRQAASAVSIVMLVIAYGLILFVNWFSKRGKKEIEA